MILSLIYIKLFKILGKTNLMLDESVDQGDLKFNLYKTFQDSWKNQFNA